MGSANIWNKTRKPEESYADIVSGDWEFRILKAYQSRAAEKKNKYARWYCAVKTPFTMGSWEYGDTYCTEVPSNELLVRILEGREEIERLKNEANTAARLAAKEKA